MIVKNNNHEVIRRLIGRALQINKRRNFFIIAAISLTTMMLATVFSIGMSFLSSIQMESVRLMGTTGHVALTQPTSEQVEQLRSLPYIQAVGVGHNVSLVQKQPQLPDASLSLHYFDQTEWTQLRAPAYSDIVGTYPQAIDEIMIPRWVLERMGISEPQIGMTLSFTHSPDNLQPVTETFRLSGWFTGYMHIRSGNIDSLLVSESLAAKYGKSVEHDGAANIQFDRSSKVNARLAQLEQDVSLAANQQLKLVPMYEKNDGTVSSMALALTAVAAFLVLSGYLLIYNVLSISVSQDVRFYGLLKTLGTTPKQIRRIVSGQIIRLCLIGIPVGLLVALLLSFVLVPITIETMSTVPTGAVISFSPLIYGLATASALLTAWLGARKPASAASRISPIEAQKFTGVPLIRTRSYRSHGGSKPLRMAWRNMFREPRRAGLVFLSLFLGMTSFTTVVTLVSSMDIDHYIATYVENDFELNNHTFISNHSQQHTFDDAFVAQIKNLPGDPHVERITEQWIRIDQPGDAFMPYLRSLQEEWGSEITADALTNFIGLISGIDRSTVEALNLSRDTPIDIDAFERGEIALIASNLPDLFANVETLQLHPQAFTVDEGARDDRDTEPHTLRLGGFVPHQFKGISSSFAPTLFVSNTLIHKLYTQPFVKRLDINVADGYEQQTLNALKNMTTTYPWITRTSLLETREKMRNARLVLFILGGGISLVLAWIGLLNFINVMSVGIMVRKKELATLACIGMSERQIRQMLIGEGFGYAVITLLLVGTIGNGICLLLFKWFQQEATYAVFTYPYAAIGTLAGLVLLVCLITPLRLYRSLQRATLIDRLREGV